MTRLDVRETVDGLPAGIAPDAPAPSSRKEKARGAVAVSRPDPWIWGSYLFLLVVSIIELYSASSAEVPSDFVYQPLVGHFKFIVIGFLIVVGLQKLHYKYFSKLAFISVVICLALVVYSSYFGVVINGAQRAIRLGGFTIQPSEMLKLALVMMLARLLAKNQMPGGVSNKGVIECALLVAVMCLSVYKNGLTNMALMMMVSLSMFLIGGIHWRKFGLVIAFYLLFGGLGYYMQQSLRNDRNEFTAVEAEAAAAGADALPQTKKEIDRTDLRKHRVSAYLKGVHPGDSVTDDNYQVKHAHYAMARGGITGRGPGNSRESARLPLAFSDYIYSIIVEDIGLWGGLLLIMAYLLLIIRAGAVASKCSRAFPALLIMGCAVMIALQAFVHMGIVTDVFPVSGQPLPLISKGGTSILVMSAAFGMMLSVSRYAVRNNDKKAIRAEIKELSSDIAADNPMQLPPRQ